MDVSSLYRNVPQKEGTEIAFKAYDSFHNYNPPIPTRFLREMHGLILNENSFQFNGENYLKTQGTAMGTKMAVSFANIFMAKIETTLIQQSETKQKEWRRYIDDIFSLWDSDKKDLDHFIEQGNKFHPSIKFTAEISENEVTFLDIVVKRERFTNESILDIKTQYKPTETFQYTHFNSCHPPGVKNGFIKGEAIRLIRTNYSKTTFEDSLVKFKQHLRTNGYPKTVIERSFSGVNFAARPSALTKKKKANERILPFVTTYHSAVDNLKQTLMELWSLIQTQPLLKIIYLKPPITSFKRGKSLKDTLLLDQKSTAETTLGVRASLPLTYSISL